MTELHNTSPLVVLTDPSIQEALKLLQKAFSQRRTLILAGNCRSEYLGRASSTLGWGDRLVIAKADRSILVHRPAGYEPVNWQPPGCLLQTEIADRSELLIKAIRSQPREILSIFFRNINFIAICSLVDKAQFALHVTEEQMRKAIQIEPTLVEEGFLPRSFEEDFGESGFTDILGEDSRGNTVVIEIKRNPVGRDAVLQLNRYVEAIRRQIDREIRGIVVAPKLRRNAQKLLAALNLEFKPLSLEKCFDVLSMQKDRRISEFLG